MAVNKEIFNKEIFNNNIFNKEVFNNQIFNKDAFLKDAFLKDAFDTTPFDINVFNKNIRTVKEVAQPRLPLQVYPVTLESLRYRRARRDYLLKQAQQEKSLLVDSAKGTEINSIRDAVLGMFNPYMEHAIEDIPEWLGILNVIPDTLKHWYDHYTKPTFQGHPGYVLLNLLSAAGESLDALANPVKAVAQGIINGDDVWENLLASTVGTKEGIKNFDWDTGNGLLNLGLEFISDPLNWGSFGFKKLAEWGFVKAPLKLTKEAMEAAGKKATKDIAKEVSGILGKGVRKVGKAHLDAVSAGTKSVTKEFKDLLFKTDAYKGFKQQLKAGELKGLKAKLEGAKDLFRINTWDEVQERLSKSYTKAYVEHIAKVYQIDPKQGKVLLDRLEDAISNSAMTKTIVDLNRANWDDMTKSVLVTLGARGNVLDDLYSRTILGLELTPTIAYPIHYLLKYSDVGHIPEVQKFLVDMNLKTKRIEKGLIDNFLALSKKPGTILKTTKKVDLEIEKMPIIDSLMDANNPNTVQEYAMLTATKHATFIEISKQILDNPKISMVDKEKALIELYQTSLSGSVNTLQDMIDMVDKVSAKLTELGYPDSLQNGFQQFKDEFSRLNEFVKYSKQLEEAKDFMAQNQKAIEDATLLTEAFEEGKEFPATYLDNANKHVQIQTALDTLTEEATKLDSYIYNVEVEDPLITLEEYIMQDVAGGTIDGLKAHHQKVRKHIQSLFDYLEAHPNITNEEKRQLIISTFQKIESGLYSVSNIQHFLNTQGSKLTKAQKIEIGELIANFLKGDTSKGTVNSRFIKKLKASDSATQENVLKRMRNIVARVKSTSSALTYMTILSERHASELYSDVIKARALSVQLENIIEKLDWEDFTNNAQASFQRALEVFKKLRNSLEKDNRIALQELIQSLENLAGLSSKSGYKYNEYLKEFYKALRTLQAQVQQRKVYVDKLPKNLKQLAKNNPEVFDKLLRTLRSADPYKSDHLAGAYKLLDKQKQMHDLESVALSKIEAIDIDAPLKANSKLMEDLAAIMHHYSQAFIEGDIKSSAMKEEVSKGVKKAIKMNTEIKKNFGNLQKAFKQHEGYLESLHVPTLDSHGNARPVYQAFKDVETDIQDVLTHIYAFENGEVPDSAYIGWYIELHTKVQKASESFYKYETLFEKNVDPNAVLEYDTAYVKLNYGNIIKGGPTANHLKATQATEAFWKHIQQKRIKALHPPTVDSVNSAELFWGETIKSTRKKVQDTMASIALKNYHKDPAEIDTLKKKALEEIKRKINHVPDTIRDKAVGEYQRPKIEEAVRYYSVSELIEDTKDVLNNAYTDMIAHLNTPEYLEYYKIWEEAAQMYDDVIKTKKALEKKNFNLKTYIQNLLNSVNFTYQSMQSTIHSTDNVISQVKLSEEAASAMLNSMMWIREFRRDPVWQELTGALQNNPEFLKRFKPVEQAFLVASKVIEEGCANMSVFRRNVQFAVAEIPDPTLRMQVENAIWSAVQKAKHLNLNDTNAENITRDILDSAQGYIRALNMTYSSRSLDMLRKDYGLVTEGRDLVLEEMQKSGIKADGGAHSALYDAVSTLLINEIEAKGRRLPVSEFVYDIETTGGLDKYGKPIGDVLEAAIIHRNEDGLIEVILDSKVQATSEEVIQKYTNTTNVLYHMDITPEEQYAKYMTKDKSKLKSSKDVLQEVYNKLLEIVNNAPDGKPIIHDYNGIKFDREYLRYSMLDESIGGHLTETSKSRVVKGKAWKQHQLEKYPSVRDLMDRIEWRDDLAEKNKDLYSIDPNVSDRVLNAVVEQIKRQEELFKYGELLNENGESILQIPKTFATEFNGRFVSLFKDATAEEAIPSFKLKDALEDIAIEYEDLEKTIDTGGDVVQEATYEIDYDNAADALEQTLGKTEELGLDPTIQNYIKKMFIEAIDTYRNIGQFNRHHADMTIVEALWNPRHKNHNPELYHEFMSAIIERYQKEGFSFEAARSAADNNLTKIFNQLQASGAYKNYRPELLKLIDITPFLKETNAGEFVLEDITRIEFDDYLRKLQNTQDRIVNLDLLSKFKEDIRNALDTLKGSKVSKETDSIMYHEYNAKQNYTQLQVIWDTLNRYATRKDYHAKTASAIIVKIRETCPELAQALDTRLAFISLTYKNESAIWDYAEKVSGDIVDYQRIATTQHSIESLDRSLRTIPRKINTGLTRAAHKLNDLYQKSFDKQYKGTKLTAQYKADGRAFTEAMYLHSTYNKLTASADNLIADLLYNTTNRTMKIYKPAVDEVFHTPELFQRMLDRTSELRAQGIVLKYDETNKVIELSLDPSLSITRSTNRHSKHLWTVNGREIQQAEYAILDQDLFNKFYKNANLNPEYKQALYDLYRETASVNKSFAGRTGITKYIDDYKTVYEDSGKLKTKDFSTIDEIVPYYDEDHIGAYSDIAKVVGGRRSDALYTLNEIAYKTGQHTYQGQQYAEFILNTGFNLNDELLQDISLQDLSSYLNKNPDMVVAYFRNDKHAVNGMVLDVLGTINPESLKAAKELGATIIPWNIYTEAAGTFNKFTYNNRFVEQWYKLIQLYKKAWLMTPGSILRNAMDSSMKDLFEGREVNQSIKAFSDAHKVLIEYDDITKQIKNIDPNGRFRVGNIDEYFKYAKGTLDRESYLYLYQVMNNMGMNSMNTMVDGVFGAFMKPMSSIERTVRLSMFLNLEGQGLKYSEIMRRISETHFNYDVSTSFGYLKALIPFHTYTFSNLNYIMHLIEENPAMLRHFMEFYQTVWNTQGFDHDELEDNVSLQYQIMNGNIPLSFFGFKDKEITREVETKYGKQMQTVKNNAVIKMGSSILDGLNMIVNPMQSLKDKLAPPAQLLMSTATEYLTTATGNFTRNTWYSYEDATAKYNNMLGDVSLQSMITDPSKIIDVLPIAGPIKQRFFHKEGDQYKLGSTTGYRTQNPVLDVLGMTGIVGATTRWGEFAQRPKQNTKRTSASYSYANRYTRRNLRTYNKTHYNTYHRVPANIKTVPQYLYSNMGRTSRGKSKTMMWMNMNTRNKVKFMSKRLAGVYTSYR